MDLLFHAVIGLLISNQLLGGYYLLPALFSLLPDLIGAAPFHMYKFKNSSKRSFKAFTKDMIKYTKSTYFVRHKDKIIYKSTHNLFAWIISSVIAYLAFPKFFLAASLAYLSHLVFDAYTHEAEFSIQPFFPFSKFTINGKSWSTNKRIFIGSWIGLGTFILVKYLF